MKNLDYLKEIIEEGRELDITDAINILIYNAQISLEKEDINDIDKLLLISSLNRIQDEIDLGEDITIRII